MRINKLSNTARDFDLIDMKHEKLIKVEKEDIL